MLTGQPRTGALAPDVFPAFGPQAFSGAAFINEHHLTAANHAADLTDAHSRDLRRDLLRRGEQQFVVLTAVEGHIQSNRAGRLSHQRTRDECGLNFGAHAAFFTEVAEVGGEAVAKVDHGGGQTAPAQELTDSYPGLGVEVAGIVCGLDFPSGAKRLQRRRRFAQSAGYVYTVSGAGAGAKNGFALGDRPHDHDVGEGSIWRLRGIAAGERNVELGCEVQKPVEKAVHPALRNLSRMREREENRDGDSAHGGKVTQATGQAAVANAFSGVPIAAEVHAFQAEIGGDQHLVAGGDPEGGAVIADAGDYSGPGSDAPAKGGYQGSFR